MVLKRQFQTFMLVLVFNINDDNSCLEAKVMFDISEVKYLHAFRLN